MSLISPGNLGPRGQLLVVVCRIPDHSAVVYADLGIRVVGQDGNQETGGEAAWLDGDVEVIERYILKGELEFVHPRRIQATTRPDRIAPAIFA